MISYIRGILAEKEEDQIVVEASSIGYEIHVPLSFLEELPPVGEEVRIYTYLQVKEDALNLFGFRSRQDLKMFKQLLGVNGIGPKGALGLLSAMRPDDLRLAVISGDAKAISKAPGIGLKTAQRLILDLKDKISVEEILMTDQEETGTTPVRTGGLPDAGKEARGRIDGVRLFCHGSDKGSASGGDHRANDSGGCPESVLTSFVILLIDIEKRFRVDVCESAGKGGSYGTKNYYNRVNGRGSEERFPFTSAISGRLHRTGKDQVYIEDLHRRSQIQGREPGSCAVLRTSRSWENHPLRHYCQ